MFHLLVLLIEQSRLSNGQHKQCSCRQENFQRRWDGRGLCSDCLLCGAEEVVSDSFRFVVTRRRTANEDSDRWSQKSFQSVFELRHYDQNFIGFVQGWRASGNLLFRLQNEAQWWLVPWLGLWCPVSFCFCGFFWSKNIAAAAGFFWCLENSSLEYGSLCFWT